MIINFTLVYLLSIIKCDHVPGLGGDTLDTDKSSIFSRLDTIQGQELGMRDKP